MIDSMKKICVHCGSSSGFVPAYAEAAKKLAETLAKQNLGLVYGGGNVGLMGILSRTMIQLGAEAYGVIPEFLVDKVPHSDLTELYVVQSMHQRKQRMFDLADAFIALPGGFGTLEEMTEILTWAQLGQHSKPYGVLNVNGYYDALLNFLEHAVTSGFIKQEHLDILLVAEDPQTLIQKLQNFKAQYTDKWISKKERL